MDPKDDTNATPPTEPNEGGAKEAVEGDDAAALDRAEEEARDRAWAIQFDGGALAPNVDIDESIADD